MWDTHVLFTNKGFYCGEYKRKMQPKVKYVSWGIVKKIKKKSILLSNLEYKFKMKREPNFESRRAYKTRKREFKTKIQPIMMEGIKLYATDFSESMKKYSEKEKDQPRNVLGDKKGEDFRNMMEFMQLQRHLSGKDKVGYNTIYKDIRERRMKNQVIMIVFDLIFAFFTLPLLLPSIFMGLSRGFEGFSISMITISIILLVMIGFHQLWIRKRNFAIRKQALNITQAKTKSEKHFIESLSNLPKNYEGMQLMKLMSLGSKAYSERDFEKCANIFKQILKFNTQMDMIWYMVLESLFYLSRWDEMVSIGEEAIKLHPNFGPLYHWLGDAYTQIGKKDKARVCYKKGIQVLSEAIINSPEDDSIINSLGYTYLGMEDYEEAIKCYMKAIKIKPKSEHHLHSLGQTYMKMGDYVKAIKYLDKSLIYNPKHSYSWFDLGLIYEDQNQLEKAVECFEKAVEYYPQWVKVREKLISIKPDSPVLIKKSQETKEKVAGDYLYDSLHTRGREDQIKRYENNLNRLLRMNEMQLISFLTSNIYSYERRFESFNKNKYVPSFIIDLLKIQKEYKEKLLKNLKEYPNYISEFRITIKNDIEFYRMIRERNEIPRNKHLVNLYNLLLEMPYVQLVKYFKEEILRKEEMIKFKPMDEREFEMRNFVLVYAKETLNDLKKNRAYIQIFRKEIKKGMDDLTDSKFSVFNDKLFYLF
jgi:tetratricopeptide (TPR) repeat protein